MCMLFMVIESFKRGDPAPVGERFKICGRMLPDGVTYQASWIDETGSRCFQIMEATDRALLDQWMGHWTDIVEFDVFPIMTSKEAAERIAPRL